MRVMVSAGSGYSFVILSSVYLRLVVTPLSKQPSAETAEGECQAVQLWVPHVVTV